MMIFTLFCLKFGKNCIKNKKKQRKTAAFLYKIYVFLCKTSLFETKKACNDKKTLTFCHHRPAAAAKKQLQFRLI